jgi:hypothetical protein
MLSQLLGNSVFILNSFNISAAYQIKLLNFQVNILNYFVKLFRHLKSAPENICTAGIFTFLHSPQEDNENVDICQMEFSVTVTLDVAHSELVTMSLNIG